MSAQNEGERVTHEMHKGAIPQVSYTLSEIAPL